MNRELSQIELFIIDVAKTIRTFTQSDEKCLPVWLNHANGDTTALFVQADRKFEASETSGTFKVKEVK